MVNGFISLLATQFRAEISLQIKNGFPLPLLPRIRRHPTAHPRDFFNTRGRPEGGWRRFAAGTDSAWRATWSCPNTFIYWSPNPKERSYRWRPQMLKQKMSQKLHRQSPRPVSPKTGETRAGHRLGSSGTTISMCGVSTKKLRHIHRNPVTRGFVNATEDWAWSSFRHYVSGAEGVVETVFGETRTGIFFGDGGRHEELSRSRLDRSPRRITHRVVAKEGPHPPPVISDCISIL